MLTKQKVIGIIIAIGILLIAIFQGGVYSKINQNPISEPNINNSGAEQDKIVVTSTNPSPLEGATIAPNQKIEITFNHPLVNDLARILIEPKVEINAEMIGDHKLMRITPRKGYELGKSYTLTIKSGYGSDDGKILDTDIIYHFSTIRYRGI